MMVQMFSHDGHIVETKYVNMYTVQMDRSAVVARTH